MCSVLPHLALLRGAGWEGKHWHRLLALLGLKGRTLASTTLRGLLERADAIGAHVAAIRALDAEAHAEAVIRKALDEIDLWGFQSAFQLLDTTDAAGSKVRAAAARAARV